jgi:acetate kinase
LSLAAIKDGKCIDTTMGLSPLEGLPMGTRSGSIDPAILEFMHDCEGLTIHQILDVLNKESGVLGISGVSSDFRDIELAAAEGNDRAELALKIFDYDVMKYIGAYMAAMGGADAIIFTAGLGENGPETRERIMSGLEGMGIYIDKEKNNFKGQLRDITGEGSRVKVLVIPTNEELVIARDTKAIVEK